MGISRRKFMATGAILAAGGAVLTNAAPLIGTAQAQPSLTKAKSAQAPGFYRTKVGSITITALLDGGMDLGSELLMETDDAMLARARSTHFLKAGQKTFPAYVNAFLIETGKKTTLIDAGGQGMAPGLGHMLSNLQQAGYTPSDVDEIIITHAHPDHTNGLVKEGQPVFGKASIHIHEAEWAFCSSDEQKGKMPDKAAMFDLARANLEPYQKSGQLQPHKSEADFGGGLSSVFLPGHTPGHSGVRVSDGMDQLIIWGDIVHVPAVQFENPQVSIVFDIDAAQAHATRKKLFDMLAADRTRFGGMHLAFPGLGHLAAASGDGYVFVPALYETDL